MTKSKYRILLVSIYNDESIGVRLIHSLLKEAGYNVQMLFLKTNIPKTHLTATEEQLFYDYIKKFNPNLLAFSLVSPNWYLYKRLYNKIRYCGDFKILIGGWQATLNPEETIKYADLICRGEGEFATLELVNSIIRNKYLYDIPNLWFNLKTKIVRNAVRPLLQDLDKLPAPKFIYDFENPDRVYIENNKLEQKDPYCYNNRVGVMASRHCPMTCTYCSNSELRKLYPNLSQIVYRNCDKVLAELVEAKRVIHNLGRVNFYDEIFCPKKEWRDNFFPKYKKEINLPFYCMFYPGTCNEELVKTLKDAGLAGVWLGIQSGSERVRKEVFKRFYSNELVFKQVELFHKYGISIKYDFIFDNPFETVKETEESIKMMAKFPKPLLVNLFSLKFFPNTEITRMALEQKLITEKQIDDHLNQEFSNYTVSEERKQEILERVKQYE